MSGNNDPDKISLEVSYAKRDKPKFGINFFLAGTIQHDKGLSENAKAMFLLLASSPTKEALQATDNIAELIQKNYIWIEGFPVGTPSTVSSDRRSWLTKVKEFFQRRKS